MSFDDEQTGQYTRQKLPTKRRGAIVALLAAAAVILALGAMVTHWMGFQTPVSKPPKPKQAEAARAPAPTPAKAPEPARTEVVVVPVASLDWNTCTKTRIVRLKNGNVRLVGEGCAPVQVVVPSKARKGGAR